MPAQTVTTAKSVFVNAEAVLSAAETLAGLVDERGHVPTQVATAINGDECFTLWRTYGYTHPRTA